MSQNDLMHPRNIFRKPPNYTLLAVKYADFRKVCKLELSGKVCIDLKKNDTLEQLTKVLLEEYFNLKITIPHGSLVPTVPLRLNYILWLEDIVNTFNLVNIHGIDIGCGAICIYCLISAKKNDWNMIGLESKKESVAFAEHNVTNNNLGQKIQIFYQQDKSVIFESFLKSVSDDSTIFDFCICNPPFFDKNKNPRCGNRTKNRKEPKNAPTGTDEELSCKGGEVAFIAKIIDESLIQRNRIRFYTTMIGSKANAMEIVNLLESKEIFNYGFTEFCQGNVTRWGIAWSFETNMDLEKVPNTKKKNLMKRTKTKDE